MRNRTTSRAIALTTTCIHGAAALDTILSLRLGSYGLASATRVVERMILSLPHVKIGLLVGIGAGISVNYPNIRLGGIAVSQPEGATGVGR